MNTTPVQLSLFNTDLFAEILPAVVELQPEEEEPEQEEGEEDAAHAARVAAFEARRAARVERLEAAAQKAQARSNAAYAASSRAVEGIPFGQPILVGHHSEGSHRAAIKRSHAAMDRSCAEADKAKHYAGRAASAASNRAISSDDPNAPTKLREKLEKLERAQATMKAVNAAIRKGDDAAAIAAGVTEAQLAELKKGDYAGRIGFASYQLTNNSAEIRRVKKRLEQAEKQAQELAQQGEEGNPVEEIGGVTITDNVEENRLQLEFPGIPSEAVRKYLKGNGFKWSRSAGVWQRHRSNAATYHARQAAQMHEKEQQPEEPSEPEEEPQAQPESTMPDMGDWNDPSSRWHY